MITALALAAVVLLAGFLVMWKAMRDAPEGEQTERGFCVTWRNHSVEASNVSCIWTGRGEQSAARHASGFQAAA